MLNVSRQSVSRWEMDAAFPGQRRELTVSVHDCYRFIRESTCFFLATSVKDRPNLRPMGMICCDHENLFIATDRRKKLKDDVQRDMYRDALPKQYQMPKVFFIFRMSTKCHALSDLAAPPAIFPLCSERIQSGRTDSQGCVVTRSLFITVVPSHFCGTL